MAFRRWPDTFIALFLVLLVAGACRSAPANGGGAPAPAPGREQPTIDATSTPTDATVATPVATTAVATTAPPASPTAVNRHNPPRPAFNARSRADILPHSRRGAAGRDRRYRARGPLGDGLGTRWAYDRH